MKNYNYLPRELTQDQKNQLDFFIDMVCEYYGIARQVIFGKSKATRHTFARAVYILWSVKNNTTDITGAQITNYINKTHAMRTYYDHLYFNDYTFKKAFDDFNLKFEHMTTVEDNATRKFQKYPELLNKFLFIAEAIRSRFVSERFRNLHLSKVKDIIWIFNTREYDQSLISLYAWFEDFANEYFPGDEDIKNKFAAL